MARVAEPGAGPVQGDAQRLAGGEGPTAVIEQDLMGLAGLFGEVGPGAAGPGRR
jgi:hypothetical protein